MFGVPKEEGATPEPNATSNMQSQVSTFVLQGAAYPPRPLCIPAVIWRAIGARCDSYAIVFRIYEQPEECQIATFIISLGEDGLEVYNTMSLNF